MTLHDDNLDPGSYGFVSRYGYPIICWFIIVCMKTSILAGYPILDKVGQTQQKQDPLNPSASIKIGQDPTALYWKLQGMVPSLYWIQQRGHPKWRVIKTQHAEGQESWTKRLNVLSPWLPLSYRSHHMVNHQLSSVKKASPLKLTARGWTYQSVGCPPHPSTKWFRGTYKMVAGYCLQNGDSSVTHLPINMRNMLAYFWVNIVYKKLRKMGEPVCKTQYPCVSTLAFWERPNCRQSTLSETSS